LFPVPDRSIHFQLLHILPLHAWMHAICQFEDAVIIKYILYTSSGF
jgi:hypothetical protein